MGMKTRIVIMKPEHKNDIFVLKKKMLEGKKFQRNNVAYLINDDHFQITTDAPWWRLWMFKRYFTTYYYAEGQTNPLPVPSFKSLYAGQHEAYKGLVDGEELAALFNPWFYRTIAAPVRDLFSQIMFYINIATLLIVVYLAWNAWQGDGSAAADAASGTSTAGNGGATIAG
jgi:hypothetical protein